MSDNDPNVVAAREWIITITGLKFASPSFTESLKSGVLLCLLLNKLRPNSVKIKKPSLYPPEAQHGICADNIKNFLQACRLQGVAERFTPDDLLTQGNASVVASHIIAMANSPLNQSGVACGGTAGPPPRPTAQKRQTQANFRYAYQAPVQLDLGKSEGGGDSDSGGKNAEARQVVLRKLVPELISQNARLKARLLTAEEQLAAAEELNRQLQERLAQMSTRSDTGDGLVMGNYNGKVVIKAATQEKLVDAVYNPNHQGGADFAGVYLMTFRHWTSSAEVLKAVRAKFDETCAKMESQEQDVMIMELLKQVVLRIASFMQRWIELFYVDFETDMALNKQMRDLVDRIQKQDNHLGNRLQSALERAMAKQRAVRAREEAVEQATQAVLQQADDGSPEAMLRVQSQRTAAMSRNSQRQRIIQSKLQLQQVLGAGGTPTDTGDIHVFDKPPPDPILPKGPINKATAVETIDQLELARQLTLIHYELFARLTPNEFFKQVFSKKDKATKAPNVCVLTDQFNDTSHWVTYNLCTTPDLKKRAALMKKFILLTDSLHKLNNLHGVFAVVAALSGAAVHRLKKTWKLVLHDKKLAELWEFLLELTNPQSSFSAYRTAKQLMDPPAIPYLGVYLQDLTFIEEGNNDKLENGYINFVKYRMISDVIYEILRFQQKPYNLTPVTEITDYLQSVRQMEEDKMFQLSLTIEPREQK